jgi:protein FAM32A
MDGVAVPGKLKLKKGSGVTKTTTTIMKKKTLTTVKAPEKTESSSTTTTSKPPSDESVKHLTKTKAEMVFARRQVCLFILFVFLFIS